VGGDASEYTFAPKATTTMATTTPITMLPMLGGSLRFIYPSAVRCRYVAIAGQHAWRRDPEWRRSTRVRERVVIATYEAVTSG
jgi:hypothetical protein